MNRNFVFQTLFEVKGRDKRTKKKTKEHQILKGERDDQV